MNFADELRVVYGSLCPYFLDCDLYDKEQVNCRGGFVGSFCGRFRELVAAEEARK